LKNPGSTPGGEEEEKGVRTREAERGRVGQEEKEEGEGCKRERGRNITKGNNRTDCSNSYQLALWLEGVHGTAYDTPCHRHHRTINYSAKQIVTHC